MKPGVKESEILEITKEIFSQHGIKNSWHNPHIRFGSNTTLLSHEKCPKDLSLEDNDIAFVDIGPIINEVEGDFGKTVVIGNDPKLEKLQKTSEELFYLGQKYFRNTRPNGRDLHEFICTEAERRGYKQMLSQSGHMIGLFAHSSAWNKGLAVYPESLETGLWVLEIQIKDPSINRAAFYEDIL